MVANENKGSPLILPEDLTYQCIQCGDCCTTFQEIPVDEQSVTRLSGYDLASLNRHLAREPAFLDSDIRPGQKIIRLDKHGHCVFLDNGNMCRIHQRYGYEAKPLNCRNFPFRFIETPAGIYVGVSFGCRSVLQRSGKPIAHYQDLLQRQFAETGPVRRVPEKVFLAPAIPITWQQYELVEADVSRLFTLDGFDLELQLIAGSIYLSMLADFVREAQRTGAHSTQEVIETYVSAMRRENYARIFTIARKARPQAFIQRMFLGMMISFRNTLTRRRRRVGAITKLMYEYLRNVLRIGRVHLLPLERGFYFSDFRRVRFDPDEPFVAHTIRAYVRHMLFRKDLVQEGEALKGYQFLLLYYALIRWYVVGIVAARGQHEPTREDLMDAVTYVEKYYAYHSCFSALFSRYPILSDTVESFFSRKTYSATMVRPPIRS